MNFPILVTYIDPSTGSMLFTITSGSAARVADYLMEKRRQLLAAADGAAEKEVSGT